MRRKAGLARHLNILLLPVAAGRNQRSPPHSTASASRPPASAWPLMSGKPMSSRMTLSSLSPRAPARLAPNVRPSPGVRPSPAPRPACAPRSDCRRPPGIALPSRSRRGASGRARRVRWSIRRQRQPHDERAALARADAAGLAAIMQLHHLPHQRQADAEAALRAIGLRSAWVNRSKSPAACRRDADP